MTRAQNCCRRARARCRPPSTSPLASSTALTAPALAPLIASSSQSGSSSSRSSTPQLNAANEPPPCRASDRFRGGQARRSARLVSALVALLAAPLWSARPGSTFAVISGRSGAVPVMPFAGTFAGGGGAAFVDQMSTAASNPVASVRARACCWLLFAPRPSRATDGSMPLIQRNHITRTLLSG